MNISYITTTEKIDELNLEGFFRGWPSPPSIETFKDILRSSQYVVLAIDDKKLVGFINAISDKTLSAYIPLLEVLPQYQNQAVGKELLKKMKEKLHRYYMIDASCDDDIVPFYSRAGFSKSNAMIIRNYENQNGSK